jgi:hypothetical protein
MLYHLGGSMYEHPLEPFTGVDNLRLNYGFMLHNVPKIQTDNKVETGNRRCGNVFSAHEPHGNRLRYINKT